MIAKGKKPSLKKHDSCLIIHLYLTTCLFFFLFVFSFYRLHDTDNNTKLDGLEILQALAHMMPADDVVPPLKPEDTAGKTTEEIKKMEDERRDKVLDYYTGKHVSYVYTEQLHRWILTESPLSDVRMYPATTAG